MPPSVPTVFEAPLGMSDFQTELETKLPGIMKNPEIYLHSLDLEKGQGLLISADREFFKNALFLNQRALTPETRGAWVPLKVVFNHINAGAGDRFAPAHFIFHTGHSGSTLISRLLDEAPSVLGLREPLPLQTLAALYANRENLKMGAFEGFLKPVYQVLTRRFSPDQQVIIKATSICNNVGAALLTRNPANRALALFVTAEVFLANMLDKKESPDIDLFLSLRRKTFEAAFPELAGDLNPETREEKIAFSWLAEAVQLFRLGSGEMKPRTLLMDFDTFLQQREIHLEKIFTHFGLPGEEEAIGRMLASPVFKGYAKKPDFPYSPENRAAILDESRVDNKGAIKKGLEFIQGLSKKHRSLEEVLRKIPLGG